MLKISTARRKLGQIGAIPVTIHDPADAPPDACVLLVDDAPNDSFASLIATETGLRVVTSNGDVSQIAKSLLAEPKMPLTLCAIGAQAQAMLARLPELNKAPPRPMGALLITPTPLTDMAWLNTSLPPLGIFAHQRDQGAQDLTTAIRKAGHRVHLEPLAGESLQSHTPTDTYKITMSLAALARGMWPH